MVIREKTIVVYDIEIFPNCFHCCCKNTETGAIHLFEISERKNQIEELAKFFYYNKDFMFCGYNNKHYDDVVINYIINKYRSLIKHSVFEICKSLFNLSTAIVKEEIEKIKPFKYLSYFQSMDLLTMMFSSKLRVGLKEMQVTMHYKNVQEYEGDFNSYLPVDEIDKMIEYNTNDVESTTELLYTLDKKGEIKLREFIFDEYKIDALSMDSVKFGETLLAKQYCEATGLSKKQLDQMRSPMDYIPLKDVILPIINYTNPTLQAVLEEMKQQVVYSKERKGYEKRFLLDNVQYSVGVGGIHSIHTPKIYKPNDDEYIGHSDVASMYPSFIIQYKWIPGHLGNAFYEVYKRIYEERIEAKHTGQKLKNLALKLTLNSVTGKMQQETSWMYDPFRVFKIRINGQLVLLMLVDRLLKRGCKIIQVNTDGVMYIAKKANKQLILEDIHEVEQITKLTFETDEYQSFYQYAVNDYFGITADGEVEKKGMFITTTNLGKGLSPVIIPKAVINYFITGEKVSEYIKRQTDIKDFLMCQRADKKFKVKHGNKQVQRINRYYASTNDYHICKIDEEGKEIDMLTSSGVTILNRMDEKPIEDRKINYEYYIHEANEIIANFIYQQLALFW